MTNLEKNFTVEQKNLASTMKSGDLDVLATPALVAFMEETARDLLADRLEPSETSVGYHLSIDHLAPTGLGKEIKITAKLLDDQTKGYHFEIKAQDNNGKIIAKAKHSRAVVDAERFMSKLEK